MTGQNYLLKGVDELLWKALKARTSADGHTIKYVIVEMLKLYVSTSGKILYDYRHDA